MLNVRTRSLVPALSQRADLFYYFSPVCSLLWSLLHKSQRLTTQSRGSESTRKVFQCGLALQALALGETSSEKYIMLEAFAFQTHSTWDNSRHSKAGVNQWQHRLAINGTHQNIINLECWLSACSFNLTYENRMMVLNWYKYLMHTTATKSID